MEKKNGWLARVGANKFPIEIVAFDKDGLLFQSQPFWCELACQRIKMLREICSKECLAVWIERVGITCDINGNPIHINPFGIFALAPQVEEEAIATALILEKDGGNWSELRAKVHDAFQRANDLFEYEKCIRPQQGFPNIFHRIHALGIPLGIVTSDTPERVEQMLSKFGANEFLSFVVSPKDVMNGKPAPDMLQKVACDHEISAEHILMIGDSYVDTEMAMAAGAIGIGVPESPQMVDRMKESAAAIAATLDDILFETI